MSKQVYYGTIKDIPEVRHTEKDQVVTNLHKRIIVEGRLEVLSHKGTDVVTQSKIILKMKREEKILDFLGEVPKEYIGKEVKLTTEYHEDGDVTEIKHYLSGKDIQNLEGAIKIRYVPQIGYFGKGQILFNEGIRGCLKRL